MKIRFVPLVSISQQAINGIADELDIYLEKGISELNRNHWTIKNVDLFEELINAGLYPVNPQSSDNEG